MACMELEDCSEHVSFIFETRYVTQNTNERLAVCGSSQILGNWNGENAIIAKEIPQKSGRWLAAVELPINSKFEWKWVVIQKDRSKTYRWEERPNRTLCSGTCPTRVRSMWNLGDEVEIPLKHKFKQIGTVNSSDENEEEWSYLPSEELLQILCKDDIEICDYTQSNEASKEDTDKISCMNKTGKNTRKNNLNCCLVVKTESFDNIVLSNEAVEEETGVINESMNIQPFTEEKSSEKTTHKRRSQKFKFGSMKNTFCTVL